MGTASLYLQVVRFAGNYLSVGFGSCMMETSFQFSVGCRQAINIPPGISRTSGRSRRQGCRHRCFFPCTASGRGVMMMASSPFGLYYVLFRMSRGGYAGHHSGAGTVVIRDRT